MQPRNCLKMAHVYRLQRFLPVGGNVINLPRELLLISRAAKWQAANCGSVTQNYLPLRPLLLWNCWQELQTRSIAIRHFQTMRVLNLQNFLRDSFMHVLGLRCYCQYYPFPFLLFPNTRLNVRAGVWVKNSASNLCHGKVRRRVVIPYAGVLKIPSLL